MLRLPEAPPGRHRDDPGALSIATYGRSRIADISAQARRVPWLINVLQLLWVAGPATFLALQGGYLLGFGEFAPMRNVIYFVFFTLFLGVIALGSKFVSVTVFERRGQEAAARLRRTIDLLPDLLFAIRDADQAAEPLEQRRRLAAGALLQELDLGPESLALAVRELTGDSGLAQVAQQIEVYRRLGLNARVQDLVEGSHEARLAALERVHTENPELADVLRERLLGRAPSLNQGIPRREGFLQRLLAAADQDDPGALPLADIQELIVLLFELVNGREIRYLHFAWKGSWGATRLLETVESSRARYRLAQARVDSRLRGIALQLLAVPDSGIDRSDLNLSSAALVERILLALERLLPKRPPQSAQIELRLRRILHEIERLLAEQQRWQHASQAFIRALEQWEQLQTPNTEAPRDWFWARWRVRGLAIHERIWARWRPRGLDIHEGVIAWSDAEKLEFAQRFCQTLDDLQLSLNERGLLAGGLPMDRNEIRRLGLHLLTLLQESLDLTNLAVQRAIQAAPAAWLGGLHTGMTADARAGLGAAVVKEVQQDLGRMAERLAAQLTTLYQLPLDALLRQQWVERYGANAERLALLAQRSNDATLSTTAFRPTLTARSALIDHDRWQRLLRQRAILNQ